MPSRGARAVARLRLEGNDAAKSGILATPVLR
jgi:hypothetical protein